MLLRTLVKNGASWLDRYDPTWHQHVDPAHLKDTDEACVLGQQYGSANEFLETRYRVEVDRDWKWYQLPKLAMMWHFFYLHGFTPIRDPESVWVRLWEDEIRKRQIGTAAPVEAEPLAEHVRTPSIQDLIKAK